MRHVALAVLAAALYAMSVPFSKALMGSIDHGVLAGLLVLMACACWGVKNNCTASISDCDPALIVAVKGIGSGSGALAVGLLGGASLPSPFPMLTAMVLGFASYGLSILAYVTAQRGLGAARTSAYYAMGPFIGVALAWVLFGEAPGTWFLLALAVMVLGSWLSSPRSA